MKLADLAWPVVPGSTRPEEEQFARLAVWVVAPGDNVEPLISRRRDVFLALAISLPLVDDLRAEFMHGLLERSGEYAGLARGAEPSRLAPNEISRDVCAQNLEDPIRPKPCVPLAGFR